MAVRQARKRAWYDIIHAAKALVIKAMVLCGFEYADVEPDAFMLARMADLYRYSELVLIGAEK